MIKNLITLSLFSVLFLPVKAQVFLAPLDHNVQSYHPAPPKNTVSKTTANTLPFFEDFTDEGIFPDAAQ